MPRTPYVCFKCRCTYFHLELADATVGVICGGCDQTIFITVPPATMKYLKTITPRYLTSTSRFDPGKQLELEAPR